MGSEIDGERKVGTFESSFGGKRVESNPGGRYKEHSKEIAKYGETGERKRREGGEISFVKRNKVCAGQNIWLRERTDAEKFIRRRRKREEDRGGVIR